MLLSFHILIKWENYLIFIPKEIKEISCRAIEFVRHNQNISIVPLSEKDAEIFGELKEQYQQYKNLGKKAIKKHNIDLIIAAAAIEIGAVLASSPDGACGIRG